MLKNKTLSHLISYETKGRKYRLKVEFRKNFPVYHFTSPNHLIVRYESLVKAPQKTLELVCEFIGIDYEEGMITRFNEWSKSRNPKKVFQPKLEKEISSEWVGRYRGPEFAERVEEFLANKSAVYWLNTSGYEV